VLNRIPYDQAFFASQRDGSLASAEVIVPLLIEMVGPRSVADIGCGVGPWASVFLKRGVTNVVALDGDYVDTKQLLIPSELFRRSDLNAVGGATFIGKFDLAICLEVAEHLDPSRAGEFVAFLTNLAPAIAFSAAIPSQGGTHHVNERWPSYWINLFGRHGYIARDVIRPKIWTNASVAYWYRQNMLLLTRGDFHLRIDTSPSSFVDVVHPELLLRKSEQQRQALLRIRELEDELKRQASTKL
jgi:SAM-dependent methyltransferase